MNGNRKISKRFKKAGNRKELEKLLENCKHLLNESWCMINEEVCHKAIGQGKCTVVKQYAKTHTLGDLKHGNSNKS